MTMRAVRANLKVVETPIVFSDRTRGKSKISRTVLLESMVMPWTLRYRASTRAGEVSERHCSADV
jgi:hypothetical protein